MNSNIYKTVNYHFSRVCNYTCEFCFFTQKNSHKASIEEIKIGIKKLKEFGIEKINFAGGEPFIYPEFLGEMIKYSKELGLATSVITNGSLVTETWFKEYGKYLDMFGISCDSFDEETNFKIGRVQINKQKSNQVQIARFCFEQAKKYNCITKINTVVCEHNKNEDMNELIKELNPDRWKVFQVLYIPNENGELNTESRKKRNALALLINKEEFDNFTKRHTNRKMMVIEESETMNNGYLMVDEFLRFIYSNESNEKIVTKSILDNEIKFLIKDVNYSNESFIKRQGEFDWYKEDKSIEKELSNQ